MRDWAQLLLHLPQGNAIKVTFGSGETCVADIVIMSIGVRPLNTLAIECGIATGQRGGIKVDEYLRTSVSDIYAVGDVIEYPHPLDGKPWMNYLAGPANRQARIVADNMVFGDTIKYEGSIGTSIAKVFDLAVAATGFAAKTLARNGMPYLTATIHPNSHAGYYPGATPMTIKVVFAPETGRLLGAQIVGCDGVDKRIDQLARIIKDGGTVEDLTHTEHAYAPLLIGKRPRGHGRIRSLQHYQRQNVAHLLARAKRHAAPGCHAYRCPYKG